MIFILYGFSYNETIKSKRTEDSPMSIRRI